MQKWLNPPKIDKEFDPLLTHEVCGRSFNQIKRQLNKSAPDTKRNQLWVDKIPKYLHAK